MSHTQQLTVSCGMLLVEHRYRRKVASTRRVSDNVSLVVEPPRHVTPPFEGSYHRISQDLAAAGGKAAGVRSPRGGLEAMEPTTKDVGRWLTYAQAARHTGWSIRHLRNLVSGGQIPVYGRPRVRRFRRDRLDLFLTNPDMAMRKFLSERNRMRGH